MSRSGTSREESGSCRSESAASPRWRRSRSAWGAAALLVVLALGLLAAPASAQTCPEFFGPVQTGTMQSPAVDEASGMVASEKNPGVFWIHNDSGDAPRAFAVAADGVLVATYELQGISAVDWEDMARGPGPTPGTSYLYFGDIGDNSALRSSITIYRVEEPTVDLANPGATLPLDGVVALEMSYPTNAHDAETLLSDPATGDLYIVTKCLLACDDGISRVFRAPFPQSDSSPTVLTQVGSLSFPGGPGAYSTTAGDIASAGDRIAIRTYTQAWWWPRAAGQTIAEALAQTPCIAPLAPELQGETLAFSIDGTSYSTVSEFENQPIWRIDEKGADQTLRGSELRLKDRSAGADASKRRVFAKAVEKRSDHTLEGDPVSRGAVLAMGANGAAPSTQVFSLLPGLDSEGKAFWRARPGGGGFRYRDARGERGAVERVALRQKRDGKFSLKVELTGRNGALDLAPPADGTDGFVTLRIPGGDRYCVQFGADGRVRNRGAELFRVENAKEEGCP